MFALVSLLVALFVALRLTRVFDLPAPVSGRGTHEVEVRIKTANPFVGAVTRACLGIAFLGLGLAWVFFQRGSVGAGIAVSILSVGLPALGVANFRLAHSGRVELHGDALVIRVRNAFHRYPWRHIVEVRTGTWAETGRVHRAFVRAMGCRTDEPFVYVRLDRAVHMSMGLWTSRYGTEISGLPMGLKRIMVFVDDPGAFVQMTSRYALRTDAA